MGEVVLGKFPRVEGGSGLIFGKPSIGGWT